MQKNYEFLTVVDISGILSVSQETVRRWIRSGVLNAERGLGRFGSSIKIKDFLLFLENNPKFLKKPTQELIDFNRGNNLNLNISTADIFYNTSFSKELLNSLSENLSEEKLAEIIKGLSSELVEMQEKISTLLKEKEKKEKELILYKEISKRKTLELK